MLNDISTSPSSIRTGITDTARRELLKREQLSEKPLKQKRAEENYIPAPETLGTLIRNAIAALKAGTIFDRGSIVNLVV